MKPPRNESLDKTLREMTRSTSPDDLAKRGIKRLRSIKLAEVTLLIERAVGRTMLARTMNVDREELQRLVGEAREEWKRLLTSQQELSGSRARIGEHRAELEHDLERLHVDEAAHATKDSARDAALERILREGLADGASPDDVVTAALGYVRGNRAHDRSVHAEREALLERRIDKLIQSLDETESVLRRLHQRRTMDVGLSSLYRVVQGLSDEEENIELKQELMGAIFEANRGLHDALRTGDGSGGEGTEPPPE